MKKRFMLFVIFLSFFVLVSCNKASNDSIDTTNDIIKPNGDIDFESKTFTVLDESDNVKNLDEAKMFGLYLLSNMPKESVESRNNKMISNKSANFDDFVDNIRNNTEDDANIVKLRKTFNDNDDNVYSFIFSDESTYDLLIPNSKSEYTFNEIESIERLNHKNFKIKFYDNKTYVFDINDTNLTITISTNYTWVINGYDTGIPIIVNNKYVTVSFDTGVDKLYVSRQIIEKNQKAKEPKINTRAGYEFLGWYNKNKKWDFNDIINKSIKLTAKWKKVADVTEEATTGLVFIYNADTDSYICDGFEEKSYYTDGANVDLPKEVIIPSTYNGKPVTEIGDGAFETYLKNSLEYVYLPDTITKIGSKAFYACSCVKSITIPSSVKSIENDSFMMCLEMVEFINLSNVNVTKDFFDADGNRVLDGESDFINIKTTEESDISIFDDGYQFYTYNNKDYLLGKLDDDPNLVLPSNGPTRYTYSIARRAFYTETRESVIFPDCVTSIGKSAFASNSLTEVILPDSVIKLNTKAFNGNKTIINVELPESLIFIDSYAFSGSSITNITIPSSVEEIAYNAFNNCPKIQTVTNLSKLNIVPGEFTNGKVALYAGTVITSNGEVLQNQNPYYNVTFTPNAAKENYYDQYDFNTYNFDAKFYPEVVTSNDPDIVKAGYSTNDYVYDDNFIISPKTKFKSFVTRCCNTYYYSCLIVGENGNHYDYGSLRIKVTKKSQLVVIASNDSSRIDLRHLALYDNNLNKIEEIPLEEELVLRAFKTVLEPGEYSLCSSDTSIRLFFAALDSNLDMEYPTEP